MLDSIFSSTTTTTTITAISMLGILGVAIVSGIIISLGYLRTHKNRILMQNFPTMLIILPPIISVIILLTGTNIASAFGLAGAFSIIRFRSALGDPKDIAYVLLSMAIGLACGMGYIVFAIIIAIILSIVMLVLNEIKFGESKTTSKILKITIPEDLDYQNVFDNIFNKYTSSYMLTKVKTTNLGSLYELVYDIETKNEINEKDFIDEIRCRNGNLNITLVLNVTNEFGG